MKQVSFLRYFYIFLFLLFIISAVLYYVTEISPLKKKEIEVQQQLNETEVKTTKEALSTSKKQALAGEANMLQEELPVVPLVSNFLIDIEKAETLAKVNIISIALTNPTSSETSSNTTGSNSSASTTNSNGTTSTTNSENNTSSEVPAASNVTGTDSEEQVQQASLVLPEGVMEQKMELTVQSNTYEDFYHFIERLEQLKRLNMITSMSYNQEKTTSGQAVQTYTVGISIYYDDKLKEDLKYSIPYLETPKSSGKFDPLQNQMTTEQNPINKDN